MYKCIKRLFLAQIRLKLQLVDGEVRKSKVRSIMNMKHCARQISAAINRSASNNMLLNDAKMVNLARHILHLLLLLRPHLLFQNLKSQIMNKRLLNLSVTLRFGLHLGSLFVIRDFGVGGGDAGLFIQSNYDTFF